MRYAVASIVFTFAIGACATQTPPPPPKIAVQPPVKHEATAPLPTGADVLAQQPSDVRDAIKGHQANDPWPIYRTPERTLYPFGQEPEPVIDCAPLRTTDIQLETGETITDVAMGDTGRDSPYCAAVPSNLVTTTKPFPHREHCDAQTVQHRRS